MALKRNDFPQGESSHTLHTPYILHIYTYICTFHSPHNLHSPHFVNYLYCLVLWFFDDDFFISFAPFEAPQRALRQLCAKRGRARAKESDREGEREPSISCASRADRVEPNASNMKKAF